MCPHCHILLVEATTARYRATSAPAVNEAVALGANVVSNSYGAAGVQRRDARPTRPTTTTPASRSSRAPATTATAWSIPAASPDVVAVGGTSLFAGDRHRDSQRDRDGVERAPAAVAAPTSRSPRGRPTPAAASARVADVSAVADPNTGVWVYDSCDAGGWDVFGGTSVAAPIVGAMYALAGNGRVDRRRWARYPYAHAERAQRRDVGKQRQLRRLVPLHRRRPATTARPVSARRTRRPRSPPTSGVAAAASAAPSRLLDLGVGAARAVAAERHGEEHGDHHAAERRHRRS